MDLRQMTCIFDSPLRLRWSRNNLAVFQRLLVAGFPGCGGASLLCALLDTQQHLACHQEFDWFKEETGYPGCRSLGRLGLAAQARDEARVLFIDFSEYKGPGECWEHLLEALKDALVVCFDAADYQHPFRLDYEYFEALATRLGWNDVIRVDVLPLRIDGICVLHLEADQVLKPVIGIVSPSSLPNLHQPGPGFGGPGPYGDSASQVDIRMGYQFISWKCALDLLVCGSPPVLPGAEEQDIGSQRGSTDRYQSSGELYGHGVVPPLCSVVLQQKYPSPIKADNVPI